MEKMSHSKQIENFGAFQLFFTLSCGDRRWDPNFAAILLEKKKSSVNLRTETRNVTL